MDIKTKFSIGDKVWVIVDDNSCEVGCPAKDNPWCCECKHFKQGKKGVSVIVSDISVSLSQYTSPKIIYSVTKVCRAIGNFYEDDVFATKEEVAQKFAEMRKEQANED